MLAIFLDLEATGLDAFRHRAIDIALKVVDVTTLEEKGSYQSVIKITPEMWEQRDLISMEINGYDWETVVSGKDPKTIREEIITLLSDLKIERGKSVFICQNPAFDRSFFSQIVDVYTQERLHWPYHWLDFASMYWAILAKENQQKELPFPEELNLSKNEIAKRYNLPPEENPHKAMNGVNHLILCYKAVVCNIFPSFLKS